MFCVVLHCFGLCSIVLGCVFCFMWVVFGCFQSFVVVLRCLALFLFVLSVVVSSCLYNVFSLF